MAFLFSFRRWLSLGIAYLVLGSLLGWHIYDERRAVDALERERLAVQARIIDENLSYQLTGTSMALASMREDLPHITEPGMAAVNRRLRSLGDALPGVSVMSVLDANGTTIASSRLERVGQSVGHSEFFQIAQAGRDTAVLHISPPFAAGSEHLSIAASKVVLDRNGAFAGLVVAILDAGYFKVLLGSVLYAPDMRVSLAHGDGRLVLAAPARSGVEGLNPDDGLRGSRDRHLASGEPATVMTGGVYAAGEERMMAQRVIRPANLRVDESLAVGVSRDLGSIFGAWRRGAYLQGGTVLALMLMGAVWLYWHQQRKRAEIRLAADLEVERLRTSAELRQSAYFSDRGRSFQSDRGRHFSLIMDGRGVRASEVLNVTQSSTISLKR